MHGETVLDQAPEALPAGGRLDPPTERGAGAGALRFGRRHPSVGGHLETRVCAGRILDIPVSLLIVPLLAHIAYATRWDSEMDMEQACLAFTAVFLRVVVNHPDNEFGGE